MGTHRASTSLTTAILAFAAVLLALALAACGGSGAAASTSPTTSPGEATVMVAASPSATPLPKGAGRGTIAFTRLAEGAPPDIYIVHTDGTGLRRLAEGARGPAWSPDGSRIAYTSVTGDGGVWVMDADGSAKRRVTPAPGGADWVAWSPDGRQILFGSTAFSGADTLVVVNTDGSGLKYVFTRSRSSGHMGYSPAWAPNGRVFFGRGSGGLGEICSIDPGGREATVVTATQIPASFSLSPDGKWLAIWDGDSDRLVRMAASGRGLAVVLVEEVSQYGVLSSWSPNGSKLVLGNDSRAWLLPRSVLHVAKTDGWEVREVPNTEDGYDPAWRPK